MAKFIKLKKVLNLDEKTEQSIFINIDSILCFQEGAKKEYRIINIDSKSIQVYDSISSIINPPDENIFIID